MKHAALTDALTPRDRAVAADAVPGNNPAYEEYLRGFDDIPVLQDAVRIPPPRPQQPDFRRGERRDVRQEPRPDAYTFREATLAEAEFLYREYAGPAPVMARAKRKKTQSRGNKEQPPRKRTKAAKPKTSKSR